MFLYFLSLYLIFFILIISDEIHPMKNLMYFLMYMVILCLILYLYKFKSLFIYMIMIIFISGLMILFAYFVSLINQSMMNYFKYMNFFIIGLLMINIMYFFSSYLIENFDSMIYSMNLYRDKSINLSFIYQYSNLFLLFFMILFLVFVLIMSYKMSYPKKKAYQSKSKFLEELDKKYKF